MDLQATVLDAFPRDRILLPIAVKGDYDTIVDAVTATGQRLQQGEARVESGGERGGSEVAGGEGSEMAGGWPLVDDTRGMMVLVMDYQSVNIDCRAGIRQVNEFFECLGGERREGSGGCGGRGGGGYHVEYVHHAARGANVPSGVVFGGFIDRTSRFAVCGAGITPRRLRNTIHRLRPFADREQYGWCLRLFFHAQSAYEGTSQVNRASRTTNRIEFVSRGLRRPW